MEAGQRQKNKLAGGIDYATRCNVTESRKRENSSTEQATCAGTCSCGCGNLFRASKDLRPANSRRIQRCGLFNRTKV